MQVLSNNAVSLTAERASAALPSNALPRATNPSPAFSPALQKADTAPTNNAPDLGLDPLLTFRKDPAGRVYYVVSDAQSGKVLGQIPPENLRHVEEGIADFLQKQEAKGATDSHVAVEA